MRNRLLPCLPLALLVLASCGDDPVRTRDLPVCDAPVTVTVAADGRVNWSPACRAGLVVVTPAMGTSFFEPRWMLRSDARMIAPGVRIGTEPAGTTALGAGWTPSPDSTYSVSVGHFAGEYPGSWSSSSFGGAYTTFCAAGRACNWGPEVYSDTTAEGLGFSARSSGTSVVRGDTLWLTVTWTNPHDVSVELEATCNGTPERMILTRNGRALFGGSILCSSPFPPPTVTVPARGTYEKRYLFTGEYTPGWLEPQVVCVRGGRLTATFWHLEPVGPRRVRPASVSFDLRDDAASAAECGQWLPEE